MYSILLLAALASPAFEDLELLDQRIQAVAPHAQPVDKRLKLAECPEDPAIVRSVNASVIVRCPALGWKLLVPVNPAPMMEKATQIVVRKGDLVECISGGPGFSVSTLLVALEDAGFGDPVRVKDPSSPVIVTALVKARGIVSF